MTDHRFYAEALQVFRAVTRTLGSLIVWTRDGSERKAGYRNPGERQEAGAGVSLSQDDEGDSVRLTGSGQTVTVPSLEANTTITVKNAGAAAATLSVSGVTLRVFGEGVQPGSASSANIALGGLVQLHWVSTSVVDVWGAGVVST